ncbi:SH3 domain-containing protein [Methylobacillus flagellatus]|uniref:SH3 domain-containing protein n=1 Tax=Methylobacillus flagellatus TaxID=405 RepID=UPI0010F8DC6D|nr:SH3 domain-containing protein [Methylobacillus flagellatus]
MAVRLPPTKLSSALLASALLVASPWVAALEFRSVSVPKAVLYDAPSAQAHKLYVVGQGYPLEVLVNLGDWIKVRDQQGSLNWVEAKQLSEKRTVVIKVDEVELRQAADNQSPVQARLTRHLVLEVLEPNNSGWVKVRHRDGVTGFVPATAVWGI